MLAAVLAAVGGKGCGFILQILAIPFAIRALGVKVYGTYVTAATLFGWVALVESGIGANALRSMVKAISERDLDRLRSVVVATQTITAVLGMLFVVIAGVAFHCFAVDLGLQDPDSRHLIRVAIILCGIQIAFAAPARIRGAYQEVHINNIFGAAASLIAAISLLAVAHYHGGAVSILIALNGPQVVMQLVNCITLCYNRPELLVWRSPGKNDFCSLLSGGMMVSAAQSGVYLEREGPKLVLAKLDGPSSVGQYACLVQVLMIIAGFITMLTTPLLPAIADAHSAGEETWWRRRLYAIQKLVLFSGIVGMALSFWFGPWLINRLFAKAIVLSPIESIGLVFWCIIVLLSHTSFITLIAIGKNLPVMIAQLLQGAAVIASFAFVSSSVGLAKMPWILGLIDLFITAIPWALAIARKPKPTQPIP
jgi:O-antigen/teichoic acid export membrane protein